MPLVRFEVRNEYGLGGKELYKDAVIAEDPKPVLDGVAVAGLVGILRQLGDLAEFAAEVFHGLQEQVASTASRSRKLVTRVQHVEASLPQLEKAILSQTSHIHYAYTAGYSLHARIRNDQNHFIYDDLPPFIMDSYEECREPPRLQLLDRFDTGGRGSCLKRYSDPTFFRRESASSEVRNGEKSLHERKARKIKQRRRSWKHKSHFPNCAPISKDSERVQSSSPIVQGRSSLSHKSDMVDPSDSIGSKDGMDFIECVLHPSTSTQPGDVKNTELSSITNEQMVTAHDSIYIYGQNYGARCPTEEETVCHSSVTCDEKMVAVERMPLNYGTDDLEYAPETKSGLHEQGLKTANAECFDEVDYLNEHNSPSKSNLDSCYWKTAVDVQDVPEARSDLVEQKLRVVNASVNTVADLSGHESTTNSHVDEHYPTKINDARFMEPSEQTRPDYGIDEVQDMLENFECHVHDLGAVTMECIAQEADLSRRENSSKLISDGSPINDPLEGKLGTIVDARFAEPSELNGPDCGIDEIQYMLENFELHELVPAPMEYIAQVADLSRGQNTSELLSDGSPIHDPLDRELGTSEIQNVLKTNADIGKGELEANNMEQVGEIDAFSESENAVTVIDWDQLDDMESETDQFVDALNTIESESESDFEGQTQKELLSFSSSKDELVENAIFEQNEEVICHREPERESYCVSNDDKERTLDDLQNSKTIVPSTYMESLVHAQLFCNVSEAEIISPQEPEQECDSVSFDHKEQVPNPSHDPTALVSMDSIGHAQSSCNLAAKEIISLQKPEQEGDSVSFDHKEQIPDASLDSIAPVSMESNGHAQSSCNMSAAEIIGLKESEQECDSVSVDHKEQVPDASLDSTAPVSMESIGNAQSSCNVSAAEIIGLKESEQECDSVSFDHKEQIPDSSLDSSAPVSMESIGHALSSCNVSAAEIISLQEPEQKCDSVSFDHKEQIADASLDSTTPVSMESIGNAQSSCNVSAAEILSFQKLEQECDSVSVDHKKQIPDASLYSTAPVSMESIALPLSSCNVTAAEIPSLQEPEDKFLDVFYDQKQQISDDSNNSGALVSSSMVESLVHAQSACNVSAAEEDNTLDCSACLSDEQSVQCIQPSSTSAEETIPAPHLSGGMSVGASNTYPLAFWTNGTLFGLQPSKPTVFSSANTVNFDPMIGNHNIPVSQSNPNTMQKVENSAAWASSLKDPGCGNGSKESKVDKGYQDAEFSNHMSHQTLDKKYDKAIGHEGHDLSKLAEHSMIHGLSNGRITHRETIAPGIADVKNVSAEALNAKEDKPSLITLLGRELLKNGLRVGSFDHVDKPMTTTPLHSDLDNKSHASTLHSITETISKGKLNSPVNSPPPSPPLEHMKISFQPIDGFETFRLKLKYPEGVDQHEASVDTFPSFQLVPEPSNLKPDNGSDSDDDTFCRSYACMSDDYLGHLSDSNSDEWESGDTSESNDPALYDGLRRISSTEFTSSSPQCEETAHGSLDVGFLSGHAVHSGPGTSFHLPTLGSKIPFSYKEMTMCLRTEEIETPHIQKSTSETPPLPPLQWRKPLLDSEDKQDQASDRLNQPFDPYLSERSIADLSKMDSAKLFTSNELDERKLDPTNLNNQVTNVGRADEEDFLHQIRTKSFNLRRTETTRLSHIPNNATSNKVTAILQKANAIRQAVASDGDDDSWSDT